MTDKKAERQKKRELQGKTTNTPLCQGKVFSCEHVRIDMQDGTVHESNLVRHAGAVAILAVLDDGRLILVEQWRRATGKILLEIPAGTLEPGEIPLHCAERELQEEIGYRANTLIPLGGFYSTPGFCTEYIHLFLGKDLEKSRLFGEDSEEIDPVVLSLEEILKKIDRHEIPDMKTIAAVHLYLRWKDQEGKSL